MGVSINLVLGEKDVTVRTLGRSIRSDTWKLKSGKGPEEYALPTQTRNVHHSERLKLLCMLDQDRMLLPSRAVCSVCADVHDRSLFSPESLAQPSAERCCIGFPGRIWICPHWTLDQRLITTSTTPLRTHGCGENVFVGIIDKRPCVYWPIALLRDKESAPSQKLVEDILCSLNLPICKHKRFCDPWISRLYSPSCRKLRWMQDPNDPHPFCRCLSCDSQTPPTNYTQDFLKLYRHQPYDRLCQAIDDLDGGKCEFCATKVVFRIVRQKNSAYLLNLIIRREIRDFQGCTDSAWIEQVTDPADFEMLGRDCSAATRQADKVLPSTVRKYMRL